MIEPKQKPMGKWPSFYSMFNFSNSNKVKLGLLIGWVVVAFGLACKVRVDAGLLNAKYATNYHGSCCPRN